MPQDESMPGYTTAARLMDGSQVRAALLALRNDVRGFDPPDDPDPQLVELVETPFDSVDDVTDRLSRLEDRLRTRGDRRAVFLTIYTRMTREVHDGIERGRFADRDWMRRYLVTFAEYYRRVFLAFERGNLGAVPDPWRIAFGTALRGDALILQDSYLGVNAHINYDLALALDDVGIDPHRSRKYRDHRAIDGILSRLVDVQQDVLADVYARGVEDLDAAFGRLDESLTLRSMTEGREQAWRIATVLTDVGWPPVHSYARWVLRATATGGAFFVLSPGLDPTLLRTLRRVENEGVDVDAVLEQVTERLGTAEEDG
jgi:hypothetical protein